MTYEESIRATAKRNGWEVYPDRDGLTIIDDEGREVHHRLGGPAEAAYDRRHAEGGDLLEPGRWCSPTPSDGVRWLPWVNELGIFDPRVLAHRR